MTETRPPLPPFTEETAWAKVLGAEAGWNTRDPERVALAYSEDSVWRNRGVFVQGRDEIRAFLAQKWNGSSTMRCGRTFGRSRAIESPCGSSTSPATPTDGGGVPMATRIGSSTSTA